MFKLFQKKDKLPQDDPIDFESMYVEVKRLGIKDYRPTHFEICKKVWSEQVPPSGQADTVQGELLRQEEKLRDEATCNGNRNWDDNFEWFCDFITETLQKSKVFEAKHWETIKGAMDYIRECGNYARRYNNGEIPYEEVNPMLFAYVDDDLYDYVTDAIGIFLEKNPTPIPYDKKDFIYR